MKIRAKTLRRLIREGLLREQEEMLKIISNTTSPETEIFNKIANYALNDDIQGALADKEVNTDDLYYDLDEMRPWVKRVGGKDRWMSDDAVVPDNWDAEAVYDFMADLERAWSDQQGQASDAKHKAAPDVKEREAIGASFSSRYVLPDDIEKINFQIRRSGGKPSNINIETDTDVSNISADWAKQHGTTLDDIIKVLQDGDANERKKQKPVKHTPPMYD